MAKRKRDSKLLRILVDVSIVIIIISVLFGNSIKDFISEDKSESSEALAGNIYIHTISVGQADSILIKAPQGNILVDAGTNSSEKDLKAYLDSVNVSSFEYCIFTHAHEDHIGGADMIIKDYSVENVIISPVSATTKTYERLLDALEESEANILKAVSGNEYKLGELTIKILAPITYNNSTDLNNTSVVLKIIYGEKSFVFTGDAEEPEENDILSAFSVSELNCDFLKVGHHGSSTSSSEEFLKTLSPSFAVISCGVDNSFGHPHRKTLDALSELNVEYFRTDLLGTVIFVCNGTELFIQK